MPLSLTETQQEPTHINALAKGTATQILMNSTTNYIQNLTSSQVITDE